MGALGAARHRFRRTGELSRQDQPSSLRILPPRRLVRMIAAGIRVT